jgi:hypothetical protein
MIIVMKTWTTVNSIYECFSKLAALGSLHFRRFSPVIKI